MPSADDSLPSDLQQEIRRGRKFSLGEAIGREGSSFLKGSQDMVPRPLRALALINGFIDRHLQDTDGALLLCLKRWVKSDVRIGKYLDEPLVALRMIVLELLEQPQTLYEFARQVAVEYGQMSGERPCFQKPGTAPHPEAAYCHESICTKLSALVTVIHGCLTAEEIAG